MPVVSLYSLWKPRANVMRSPTEYESGWTSEKIGTVWRKEKSPALSGTEPLIVQPVVPMLAVRNKWFVANIYIRDEYRKWVWTPMILQTNSYTQASNCHRFTTSLFLSSAFHCNPIFSSNSLHTEIVVVMTMRWPSLFIDPHWAS